jgi:hypothetical protein
MSKIPIPEFLLDKLGPEMKMDIHWIDVRLHDRRLFKNLVVRGSRYITGHANDPDGEGLLPFSAADIQSIRRTSFLPFLW